MLLLEVKWGIAPGTPSDAARAERRIEQGSRQVRRIRDAVLSDPREYSKALFDPGAVSLNSGTDIRVAVVGRGHVGLHSYVQSGVEVWLYDLVASELTRQPKTERMLSLWADKLGHLVDLGLTAPLVSLGESVVRLAGRTFVIDGFRIDPTRSVHKPPHGS